jgi:hypothetical protein
VTVSEVACVIVAPLSSAPSSRSGPADQLRAKGKRIEAHAQTSQQPPRRRPGATGNLGRYRPHAVPGSACDQTIGPPPGAGRVRHDQPRRAAREFVTVYPGWYPGRTVHVHAKVHLDRATVLTTQLYFDDDLTTAVFKRAPYAAHGERDQRNDTDGIFDAALLLTLAREDGGYRGVMTFDVQRA